MPQRFPYIILTALLPLMAHAAPTPSVETSTAEAKAAFARLNTKFQAAQSMRFDCTATVPNGQFTNQADFTVSGSAQRPNKFSIEVKHADRLVAVIISDGQTEYTYNPATQRYARSRAIGSFQDVAKGLAGGLAQYKGFAVFDADALPMVFVTEPVAVFLHAQTDLSDDNAIVQMQNFGSSIHYTYVLAPATVNGTPVVSVIQSYAFQNGGGSTSGGSGDLRLSLRKDDGLPLSLVKNVNVAGHAIHLGRYNFRSFQVSKSPLSASAFTWTPPPGAKLFHPTP